jgi:hypothetical protein
MGATNRQIAGDYSLWLEYHDPDGLVDAGAFTAMSEGQRLQSIEDAHGADEGECIYCQSYIEAGDFAAVPDMDDGGEWSRLATQHQPDCEWIYTRAHRINVA